MGKIHGAHMGNVRRRPCGPHVGWPWANAGHPAVNSWAGYGQIDKFVGWLGANIRICMGKLRNSWAGYGQI